MGAAPEDRDVTDAPTVPAMFSLPRNGNPVEVYGPLTNEELVAEAGFL